MIAGCRDREIKVVLVGDVGIGKSSLILRYSVPPTPHLTALLSLFADYLTSFRRGTFLKTLALPSVVISYVSPF